MKRKLRLGFLKWIGILLAVYVLSYFVLMNRNRPTSPYRGAHDYFESSFRWAPLIKASKSGAGPDTPYPEVTVWNLIYCPLDFVYFKISPRSQDEVEELRKVGYFR